MSATMPHMKIRERSPVHSGSPRKSREVKKGEEKQKSQYVSSHVPNGHSKQMQNSKQKTRRQNTKYASNHFPNGSSKETVSVCSHTWSKQKHLRFLSFPFHTRNPLNQILSLYTMSLQPGPNFEHLCYPHKRSKQTYLNILSFQFHTRQPLNQILALDKMSTQLVPIFEHVCWPHKWSCQISWVRSVRSGCRCFKVLKKNKGFYSNLRVCQNQKKSPDFAANLKAYYSCQFPRNKNQIACFPGGRAVSAH